METDSTVRLTIQKLSGLLDSSIGPPLMYASPVASSLMKMPRKTIEHRPHVAVLSIGTSHHDWIDIYNGVAASATYG